MNLSGKYISAEDIESVEQLRKLLEIGGDTEQEEAIVDAFVGADELELAQALLDLREIADMSDKQLLNDLKLTDILEDIQVDVDESKADGYSAIRPMSIHAAETLLSEITQLHAKVETLRSEVERLRAALREARRSLPEDVNLNAPWSLAIAIIDEALDDTPQPTDIPEDQEI